MSNAITALKGPMGPERDRSFRWAPLVVATVSLVVVSLMVMMTSRAAFSGTTDNAGNSWDSGSVALSDNQASAMFSATNMVPGDVVTNSITVTNDSTAASVNVRLYGDSLADADSLAQYLNLTVTVGGVTKYSGTLANFAATHTNFGNGADDWNSVAPGATRIYDFRIELDAGTPNTHQNASAQINFVWEATSNATQS